MSQSQTIILSFILKKPYNQGSFKCIFKILDINRLWESRPIGLMAVTIKFA